MREKRKTLHGRSTGFKDQKRVNGRDRQPQYNDLPRNLKPFDTKAYCQSVDQIIIDAVAMLSGWQMESLKIKKHKRGGK